MSAWLPSLALLKDTEPHPAAWNMAMDEALLDTAQVPVLRFYRWARPTVSFGCFQRWAEVAARFPDRDLVRRPTGGGAVEHGDGEETATYALVVPRAGGALAALGNRPMEAFRRVHEALGAALTAQGFAVKLHGGMGTVGLGGACFHDAPVPGDLVDIGKGRKVAGAAQRRTRMGLLHQGSIRLSRLNAVQVATDFANLLMDGNENSQAQVNPGLLRLTKELTRTKYALPGWTELR